ncbi:hypothetical protein RI845_12645 [Thalassotalea nanhaiensis]|uniref:Lipoprotein n=1 Tax=Thalassotalea nanhaiensis TaxID=3065648 RepID=A0ABY9TEP7_9GAMM|nr:hypothetical protein RI845_12115 [Colwelliaceae bacterium SQ345]WNC67365.1 hypothetical protein RI845_12645 [Colwelliaceae bacterium SQ345]
MRNLVTIFLILFSINCFATQQIEDDFIVDGKAYELGQFQYPLENLYKFEDIHSMLGTQGVCTANWRDYKATWELKDNELWINSMVKGACEKEPALVDPVLFFGEEEYPVKVVWYNGDIKLRLSSNDYQTCLDDIGGERPIGYKYSADVYEFSAGKLVYKSKQTITKVWEHALADCTSHGQE